MKNKIIGIIGLVIILLSIFTFSIYSNEFKNNSKSFGEKVVVAKGNISGGEVLSDSNTEIRTITKGNLIKNGITEEEYESIKGKVAAIDISINEQISKDRILEKDNYYPETLKIIAIKINTEGALSGNLVVGDEVEIWENDTVNKISERKATNIKILGIKDSQNQDVTKQTGTIPTSVIIQVKDETELEQIKQIPTDYLFIAKSTNQLKEKLEK